MYNQKTNYGVMPKTLGGLIEDVFQNGFQRAFGEETWNEGTTVPVNIEETDTAYELQLMAPGGTKEEFKLNIENDMLTISYEHSEEATDTNRKWLRKEYKMKNFRRSFTLNNKINASGISARYNDGILVVTLPKKEKDQPLKQQVTVD